MTTTADQREVTVDTQTGLESVGTARSVEPSGETGGVSSLNPQERETVVNASDGDGLVRIWSAQRTVITRLRKHPAFTEINSGSYGSSVWAEFTIPADRWNPASGAKRTVEWSEERRAAQAARFRENLEASTGSAEQAAEPVLEPTPGVSTPQIQAERPGDRGSS